MVPKTKAANVFATIDRLRPLVCRLMKGKTFWLSSFLGFCIRNFVNVPFSVSSYYKIWTSVSCENNQLHKPHFLFLGELNGTGLHSWYIYFLLSALRLCSLNEKESKVKWNQVFLDQIRKLNNHYSRISEGSNWIWHQLLKI